MAHGGTLGHGAFRHVDDNLNRLLHIRGKNRTCAATGGRYLRSADYIFRVVPWHRSCILYPTKIPFGFREAQCGVFGAGELRFSKNFAARRTR